MNKIETAHWILDYGIMLCIASAYLVWKVGYWPFPLTETAVAAWLGILVFAIWQAVKFFS